MSRELRVAPVAVTGIGCISSCGIGVKESVDTMLAGGREPAPPSRVVTTHEVAYPTFETPDHPLVDGPNGEHLLRSARLTRMAVAEALEDAGQDRAKLARLRCGVVVGTTVGCSMNNEDFNRSYYLGERPAMAQIECYLSSNPADVIAADYGLGGPRLTLNNACSSGTDAIGVGASWIRSGLCDLVIAGGADDLCRIVYAGFISLLNHSERPCRPFDRDRDGLNLGEGAGFVILEREPGTEPVAEVLGYGSACDAYHMTAPKPDGDGLRRAVTAALAQAGRQRDQIDFVNAHGTGTIDNDKVEAAALHDFFPGVPYLSTKGFTGHTLGAAGGLEAVFAIEGLRRGVLPANRGFENEDPELASAPISEITELRAETAMSQSLAFGGTNSAVVLGRGRR